MWGREEKKKEKGKKGKKRKERKEKERKEKKIIRKNEGFGKFSKFFPAYERTHDGGA